jgi:ureidoacrylate peracid hydrolase
LHKVSIPRHVIDRVVARRGRERCFEDMNPVTTALIVVDMQNGFIVPGLGHGTACKMAPEIAPNINATAAALRETGGNVVWIRNTFTEESKVSWSVKHEMAGPERTARRWAAMAEGTKGHQLWSKMDVRPQDLIVNKTRFSAFLQGSSDLEARLRERRVDTVAITGIMTNTCVESTARDAMMCNFRTIVISDATATESDDEHNASLIAIYLDFSDLMTTDMVISLLRRNAGKPQAHEARGA